MANSNYLALCANYLQTLGMSDVRFPVPFLYMPPTPSYYPWYPGMAGMYNDVNQAHQQPWGEVVFKDTEVKICSSSPIPNQIGPTKNVVCTMEYRTQSVLMDEPDILVSKKCPVTGLKTIKKTGGGISRRQYRLTRSSITKQIFID